MVTKRKGGTAKSKSGTAKGKRGTLSKVGTAVKEAAQTVAQKADEYVVDPVGKALGLTGKKKAAKRPAAKKTTAGKAAKAPTAKKATTAKRGARGK